LYNERELYMINEDKSLLKWECTLFFQNNPYTVDTALGIARRIGRQAEAVRHTLNELVRVNILEKIGETDDAVYRYQEAFSASQIDLS
jgi:hypothetical protein